MCSQRHSRDINHTSSLNLLVSLCLRIADACVRQTGRQFRDGTLVRPAGSSHPLATRAASGIPEFDKLLEKAKAKAPTRSLVTIEDVGAATAFLAHDAARLITGDTIYIDGGYHVVD